MKPTSRSPWSAPSPDSAPATQAGGADGKRYFSAHLAPLLAYLVLALALTWPLVLSFTTHVPGDGIDDPSLAWNLWWIKHALVDQPQNPFACDWQFWPVGINLAFYTLTILNGLLSVPIQTVFGLVSAYNLLLLSSFVLGGYGAYLLAQEFLRGKQNGDLAGQVPAGERDIRAESGRERAWFGPRARTLAAFLGGALYAFASAKLFYAALGQGNIASSQWAPFAALYILRAARARGTYKDAALAGLFVTLQAYAELTYVSFLVLFVTLAALYALWEALRLSGRPAGKLAWRRLLAVVGRFAVIGGIAVLGLAPFLANMLPDLKAEGDFFSSGGGFSDIFSADLAGYLLPTQLHPVFGNLTRSLAHDSVPQPDGTHFAVNKGQHIYVGYVGLALALAGIWAGRRRAVTWLWTASAGLFFLLSLGPSLRLAGHDLGLPLPFALVAQLPFFEGNRYPSRYSVMLLMSLAPLAAGGVLAAMNRFGHGLCFGNPSREQGAGRAPGFGGGLLFAGLLTLLLCEHLSLPLPLFDLRVPDLYQRVAAEPDDFALLEYPLGWRNGARVAGKQDVLIMQQLWYQSAHGKRLLGGNTSRNPQFKFQYFSEDPTLAWLIALANVGDVPQHTALRDMLAALPITAADRARAADWTATLGIRYVMVHRDKLPPGAEAAMRDLLPVTLVAEDGNLALYAIPEGVRAPVEFAVGVDSGRMVLAEGWSPPARDSAGGGAVYAERDEVRLMLPLGRDVTQIHLQGRSLAPEQVMTLLVEGKVVASLPWPQTMGWLSFMAPADPLRPPLSDVRLQLSRLVPVQALASEDFQTRAVDDFLSETPLVSILVRSAGQESGDFAQIYVNGVDVSSDGRGYNLVAIDPGDGQTLSRGAFDTHFEPEASLALAQWVEGLPLGAILVGAVRDEAAMSLGQVAVETLATAGVAADLRGEFRWGHAFLGKIGWPRGRALERVNAIRPAQISVGLPVTSPQVAAELVYITIDR